MMNQLQMEPSMPNPKIWVFMDHKTGSNMQALTLASKLGLPFEEKHLKYNFLTFFPSCLISLYPINLKRSVLTALQASPAPDIIISCGRRRASLALYLKKYFANKPKIINLFHFPYMPYKSLLKFDLFVLSEHDEHKHALKKSIKILGNVNDVGRRIKDSLHDYEMGYPDMKEFIAVNIGGQTINALWCTKCRFTLETAKSMSDILERLSKNHKLPLFISFSRRTPKHVKAYMKDRFSGSHICYDPKGEGINPYPAFMHYAKFVITTSDSTSMCSEIAGTGKPLYIFYRENCNKKKCERLLEQLMQAGIARTLKSDTEYLEAYSYMPLSEIDKVVARVQHDILACHE